MKRLTMTPDMTKVVNRRAVLDYLLKHGRTSRVEIGQALQLSKPTVSLIVSELTQEGFIREMGLKQVGLGRPFLQIELDTRARFAIGVELGVSTSRLIVTDILERPLDESLAWREMQIDTRTPLTAARGLCRAIKDVLDKLGHDRVLGVGVGVPAIINSSTMEIVGSNPLNWNGPSPFGSIIQDRLKVPVLVTQRVMAAAWAERMFGCGQQAHTLLYARFGSGIATGIILNDQIYTGASHMAGDIAHMTVIADVETAESIEPMADRDGQRDGQHVGRKLADTAVSALASKHEMRLQDLISREAITRRAQQLSSAASAPLSAPLTLEGLCEAARAGDEISRKVIEEAGRYIGIALSNVVGVLNPQIVVIGGPLAAAGEVLLNAVSREMQVRCSPYAYSTVKLFLSELGDRAPAWGAASLALKQFLSPTRLPHVLTPFAA